MNTNILQQEDCQDVLSFLKNEIEKKIGKREFIKIFSKCEITVGNFVFNFVFENLQLAEIFKQKYINSVDFIFSKTWDSIDIEIRTFYKNEKREVILLDREFVEDLHSNTVNISEFNSSFNFENFLEDETNKHSSILMKSISCYTHEDILEEGFAFFLTGEEGTGKTHLMQSARNYYAKHGGSVLYIKGREFLANYIEDASKKNIGNFFNKMNNFEVLLIDEIDILIGKKSTTNTLIKIIKHYIDSNRYIVCSSRFNFKDIESRDERFKDLLNNKIESKIQKPILELKKQIINKEILEQNIQIPMHISTLIASTDIGNIKAAKNNLNKIKLYQKMHSIQLNESIINSILKEQNIIRAVQIEPAELINKICEIYYTDIKLIFSKLKMQSVCKIRNICIYFMYKKLHMSYSQIGHMLDKKHSTIILSLKNIEENLTKSPVFKEELIKLESSVF